MKRTVTVVAAIGALLAGTAAASIADAQPWRGGHRDWGRHHRRHDRGNDVAAAAVVAGLAGLLIGGVLASNGNDRRERYAEPPPEYLPDPCAEQDCGAPGGYAVDPAGHDPAGYDPAWDDGEPYDPAYGPK